MLVDHPVHRQTRQAQGCQQDGKYRVKGGARVPGAASWPHMVWDCIEQVGQAANYSVPLTGWLMVAFKTRAITIILCFYPPNR